MAWNRVNLLAASLTFTACQSTNRSAGSQVKVIGGDPVAENELPGVVYLKIGRNACTATKIAPRLFMTAAHCVINDSDNDLEAPLIVGGAASGLGVSTELSITAGNAPSIIALTTDAVFLPPEYLDSCRHPKPYCFTSDLGQVPVSYADVAVIRTESDIESIPSVPIADRIESTSQERLMAGYGCESPTTVGRFPRRLMKAPAGLAGETDFVQLPNLKARYNNFRERYVVTLGQGLGQGHASLCPGDSGGPLLVKQGGVYHVAAVNSAIFRENGSTSATASDIQVHASVLAAQSAGTWLRGVIAGSVAPTPMSEVAMKIRNSRKFGASGTPLTFASSDELRAGASFNLTPGAQGIACVGLAVNTDHAWQLFRLPDLQSVFATNGGQAGEKKVPLSKGYYFVKLGESELSKPISLSLSASPDLSLCTSQTGGPEL